MLFILTTPVVLEGSWWASRPMVRETLILPDDSVPKEEDAKIVIKAYQKFRFAYYHKGGMGVGGTLNAGYVAVREDDEEANRKYLERGYKLESKAPYGDVRYNVYYYTIPYVETLVVYVRSKEERCSLIMSADIRMLNKKGEETEGVGWELKKFILTKPNKWERIFLYLPDILGPNPSFNPVYGVSFTIGPSGGATDSCATFEVGPIYLK